MKDKIAKKILKMEKDKLMSKPESDRDWELITALDIAIKALEDRPHGEWIVDEDAFSKEFRKCSNCNEDAEWLEGGGQFLPNFCPNCGADMRGGKG